MVIIPHVSPCLHLNRNTALVGSSGSLKKSQYGSLIDNYNDVIRFNYAPTNGFQSDVGSKTTLRVVNNHVFDNFDLSKEGYTKSPKNFVRELRNQKILYVGPTLKPWSRRSKNAHFSNDLFLFDYKSISVLKNLMKCNFSQNLLVGTIIIGLCVLAGIRPTIFGFDLKPRPRTHYWQERPKNWNSSDHNPLEEQKVIIELASRNLINVA